MSDDEFARLKADVLAAPGQRARTRRWLTIAVVLGCVAVIVGGAVYVVAARIGRSTGRSASNPGTAPVPATGAGAVVPAPSNATPDVPATGQITTTSQITTAAAVPTSIDTVTSRATLIAAALHSSGAAGGVRGFVMGLSSRSPLWAPNHHSDAAIVSCALASLSTFLDLPGRVTVALDGLVAGGTPLTKIGPMDLWAAVRYDRIDKVQQLEWYFVYTCAGVADGAARKRAQL